jgi:hypothetical protein
MRTNTPRPVAVDFSEMEPVRAAPIKILVGSGVAALCMIIGTVYALSAGGVFEANAEVSHEPSAAASKPAAPAPMAEKPAEPRPAAKPAEEKPSEEKSAEAGRRSEPQTQPVSAKEEMMAAPEPAAPEPKQKAKDVLEAKEAAKAKGEKAGESSEEEANESPRGSRAERRMAARLRKRAIAAEEPSASAPRSASALRGSKPRAAAAASTEAVETDESPKGGADAPGSTFNKQAAKTALDDAAAQARNCRPQGGPSGSGKVQVRYEPTGKVSTVSILSPQFDNTTTGSCVVMVFRRASIPAFTGSPAVVMNKNFEIP